MDTDGYKRCIRNKNDFAIGAWKYSVCIVDGKSAGRLYSKAARRWMILAMLIKFVVF